MDPDYIIVGAGSAGCVLAERLSRDGRSRVLLLEAGQRHESLLFRMPRGMIKLFMDPDYFWLFPVEPQPHRTVAETWGYGKGLGGSSAVNGTWYHRGYPRDFDGLAAEGINGWGWAEIERCYREMEDYSGPGADASRGRGGPLEVRRSWTSSPLFDAIIEAGRQTGLPVLSDVNAPDIAGIGRSQMTVDRRGRRVSGYTAFLKKAEGRGNLEIRTGIVVKRVTFEGKRATGVVCDSEGTELRLSAKRDVIIAAGVLQSPKLLQLSGIGAPDLLGRHGIEVVHANDRVGRNMSEHMMIQLSYRLRELDGLNREFRGWRTYANVIRYLLTGRGPMASNVPEVTAMLSSKGDGNWPNIQIGISPFSMPTSRSAKTEPGRGQTETVPGITAIGFFLRPDSRGTVSIRSTRPEDPPIIAANWFGEASDRNNALDMMKAMRTLMRQSALARYVGEETVPGADIQSDDALFEAAEWLLSTGLHATGTCLMAPPGRGVVDERLRVHGVEGLRVVDCSVLPPVSGNTNGPAMALAWRASEIIESRN